MILAQAYNIHRHLHKDNSDRRREHMDFKWEVIEGLLTDSAIWGNPNPIPADMHVLVQYVKGSRNDNTNRRKQTRCVNCTKIYIAEDGTNKCSNTKTTWYCNKCNKAYHPECFVTAHVTKGLLFQPTKV